MTRKPWSDKGSRHARGYDSNWDKLRQRILLRDLYHCQECKRQGKATLLAVVRYDHAVDHIVPKHQGGTDDETNLESLCLPCHTAKTGREAAEGRGVKLRDRPTFDSNGRVEW